MSSEESQNSGQWVLFVCTGNYYRSRFAEAIFKKEVASRGLSWSAFSRGLDLQPHVNFGPLSRYTSEALEARGIPIEFAGDEPMPLTRQDLEKAQRVIALKEAEHRPLMQLQFPDRVDSIQYWKVHDLDVATADEALPQIEGLVMQLVSELNDS